MNILTHRTLAAAVAATLALAGAAHAQAPDDAQIAAIVVAANTVDIDAGKLARERTKNDEVRRFAQQMVADHGGVNKQAVALVTRLKVKPQESELSRSLTQGGKDNLARLKRLEGKAFDKAYIGHEVAYHQTVIDALDKTLIPHAANAELKDTLVKVRPAFVAHLEHARQLAATLD